MTGISRMTKSCFSRKQGLLFLVSAPAGTGKTTLIRRLVAELPHLVPSISYTTRQARPNEKEGEDYFFVSQEEFSLLVAEQSFLEWVEIHGAFYGTSKQWVEQQLHDKKDVVLTIDTQGVSLIRQHLPCISVFIEPPSQEELRRRLLTRQTESPEEIESRIAWSHREMEARKGYDYCFVNDHLESAYQVLRSIFIAEQYATRHVLEEN